MNATGHAKTRHQATPKEVCEVVLQVIQACFYHGRISEFHRDRRDLLRFVVLWPAKWLDERGVSLPADRYRQVVCAAIRDAAAHREPGVIRFVPVWLGKVIQSHFAHQGEAIYEEAKSIRAAADHVLLTLRSNQTRPRDDTVSAMANLAEVLRPKRRAQPSLNTQLKLL